MKPSKYLKTVQCSPIIKSHKYTFNCQLLWQLLWWDNGFKNFLWLWTLKLMTFDREKKWMHKSSIKSVIKVNNKRQFVTKILFEFIYLFLNNITVHRMTENTVRQRDTYRLLGLYKKNHMTDWNRIKNRTTLKFGAPSAKSNFWRSDRTEFGKAVRYSVSQKLEAV